MILRGEIVVADAATVVAAATLARAPIHGVRACAAQIPALDPATLAGARVGVKLRGHSR